MDDSSVFDPEQQNLDLNKKIVAGLERISQAMRQLLWQQAAQLGLSPIQLQILIFVKNHTIDKATITFLANEFGLTKPTISDAVKTLLQKGCMKKAPVAGDNRSYALMLTTHGRKLIIQSENYILPLLQYISAFNNTAKEAFWQSIVNLIGQLNQAKIITVQRMCYNCKFFTNKDNSAYCNLLKQQLKTEDIRIDCPEFEAA